MKGGGSHASFYRIDVFHCKTVSQCPIESPSRITRQPKAASLITCSAIFKAVVTIWVITAFFNYFRHSKNGRCVNATLMALP